MEQSTSHDRSELHSELRGVLPFWTGVVLGTLLGFLATQFTGQLTQAPAAPLPPTQTIVKEKTIMPAWMRDGKILTTADGTAVIVCDDCPCDGMQLIETECCENGLPAVMTATVVYTPSQSNPNPDICMSGEQQIQLTRQAPDPIRPGTNPPEVIWQGTHDYGCDEIVTVQLWCVSDGSGRFTLSVWCGESRITASTGVGQCEPFEFEYEDIITGGPSCCPGVGTLEVAVTE